MKLQASTGDRRISEPSTVSQGFVSFMSPVKSQSHVFFSENKIHEKSLSTFPKSGNHGYFGKIFQSHSLPCCCCCCCFSDVGSRWTPHNNKLHTAIPWQQIRFKRQVAARFCNLCWRYATCCCNTWHSAKKCWGESGMEVVWTMMTGCAGKSFRSSQLVRS